MILMNKALKWKKLVAVVGALMALPLTPTNVTAKDLGVYGKTYPITEQDFLLYLMAKIADLKASGKWADIERQMQETTQKEALNPTQPYHYPTISKGGVYMVDPTLTIEHDIRLPDGRLLAHKGHKVNPFDYLPHHYDKVIIFINGTDMRQVEWASQAITTMQHSGHPYYLILTQGNLKTAYDKLGRIYFDYHGFLSTKLGIKTVPSIVSQVKNKWQVQQVSCSSQYCQGGKV